MGSVRVGRNEDRLASVFYVPEERHVVCEERLEVIIAEEGGVVVDGRPVGDGYGSLGPEIVGLVILLTYLIDIALVIETSGESVGDFLAGGVDADAVGLGEVLLGVEELHPVRIAIVLVSTLVIDYDRILVSVRGMLLKPFVVGRREGA